MAEKVIQTDTRQQMKKNHHQIKEQWFIDQGYKVIHSKMVVGDYCVPSRGSVAVDTKQNLSELYNNLIQQHERFRNECILAQECGIKLYVLVENEFGYIKPDDIKDWKNPQMFRYFKARNAALARGQKPPKQPASNVQLIKIMHSMSRDYGVEFLFCSTTDAGAKILELLGETNINGE